jgi:hypothetical protein
MRSWALKPSTAQNRTPWHARQCGARVDAGGRLPAGSKDPRVFVRVHQWSRIMKTKSAYVRYSGALAVALLAFSFNLGTTNAVRADELVELTPATKPMVLNLSLSAAAESEAISACTAEVAAEFCECPVTVVQTAAEPSEAKDDTRAIEAAAEPAEVDAAPPGSEAAAEPEKPEAAVETISSEAAAEPVEAAATKTEPTLTIVAAAEQAADSDEVEYAGSLPNTGAAIIWYPEVEVSIP